MKRIVKPLSLALLLAFLAALPALAEPAPEVGWTPSGEKYHRVLCRYLKNRSGVKYGKPAEAEAKGLTPCKVCKPEE